MGFICTFLILFVSRTLMSPFQKILVNVILFPVIIATQITLGLKDLFCNIGMCFKLIAPSMGMVIIICTILYAVVGFLIEQLVIFIKNKIQHKWWFELKSLYCSIEINKFSTSISRNKLQNLKNSRIAQKSTYFLNISPLKKAYATQTVMPPAYIGFVIIHEIATIAIIHIVPTMGCLFTNVLLFSIFYLSYKVSN